MLRGSGSQSDLIICWGRNQIYLVHVSEDLVHTDIVS